MINAIGAFIFTVIVLGVRDAKLDTSRFEQRLAAAPLVIHAVIFVLLVWIGWYSVQAATTQAWSGWLVFIINTSNLWIHEAGHGYCMFFPEAVLVAGGTALQLAVPVGLAIYMGIKRRFLLACLFAFWFAQNLPGVGAYIADARAQKLDLLGGSDSIHDWGYMLGRLNLLNYDLRIGSVINVLGILGMAAALGGYIWWACIGRVAHNSISDS